MSEIDELQARLAQALSRIDTALASHRAPQDNSSMLAALKEQLDEERVLTAQLQERIRALHDKEANLVEAHASEMAHLQSALDEAQLMRDEVDAILSELKPQLEDQFHA
ncbi:MAG: hypothetical protein ABI459_12660 [Deltaproteobacteria bacterium]